MKFLIIFLPIFLFGDSVYIDEQKGFMWQNIQSNKEVLFSWEEAKEHCENLRFYGHEDWWLPSEDEIVSIVDITRKKGKKIKKELTYFQPAPYWTSTTYAFNAPHAWYVDFNDGVSRSAEKEKRFYVRCIKKIGN